jgi:hypothetical protein
METNIENTAAPSVEVPRHLPNDEFGLCECGDRFTDISALMAHKLRHHMLEWPNVADAAKRLRVNLELQGARYITVRSDDVETLLGFAEKKANDERIRAGKDSL